MDDFLLERIDLPEPMEKVNGPWLLHVDGSSESSGYGVGIILRSSEGDEYDLALRLNFKVTNNETKYEALIARMRLPNDFGVPFIDIFIDSQLVAEQYSGSYETKEESMLQYLNIVKELEGSFDPFSLPQISREKNDKEDSLSKLVSSTRGMRGRNIQFRTSDYP